MFSLKIVQKELAARLLAKVIKRTPVGSISQRKFRKKRWNFKKGIGQQGKSQSATGLC